MAVFHMRDLVGCRPGPAGNQLTADANKDRHWHETCRNVLAVATPRGGSTDFHQTLLQ